MSGAEPALLASAAGAAGTAGTAAAASAIPAWLSAAGTSALMGGIGSALMGGDPLKGALLGGLTGGIGQATGLSGAIGDLFSGGSGTAAVDAASGALDGAPGALAQSGTAVDLPWTPINEGNSAFMGPMQVAQNASTAAPAASSTGLGGLTKFLPYAGLAGGAMMLDNAMAPDQVGPDARKPRESGAPVSPLSRTTQNVDPQSYFGTGGNRSFFQPYGMSPQFMADGGEVDSQRSKNMQEAMMMRAKMDGDPMADQADFVIERYRNSKYPGTFSEYMKKEYGDVPLTKNMKKFANGGSSSASSSNIPSRNCYGIGGMIKGKGDGRSDDIPAMLSDGEFVFSAPAVSAFGNGSNDAGAKKLEKIQKGMLQKHYKGGKATKAMGLGGYA